jgi:acetyl-CoA carboxylase carboxyl transferase subunit beta
MPRSRPQIHTSSERPSLNGWMQCTHCKGSLLSMRYQAQAKVCEVCGYHGRLTAFERIAHLADPESFSPCHLASDLFDPLCFQDSLPYARRWVDAGIKAGIDEALIWGTARLHEIPIVLAVMDFGFMGGSMGTAVGERLALAVLYAISHNRPLITVCASGGARMQEGLFSLYQMAKTAQAFQNMKEACIPSITLLTDPTCGGVTASFGTLGDLIIAEPGALICFTGPRVIEQNLHQKLPPEFQRAEFLLQKGMIDRIIPRNQQRSTLARLCRYLQPSVC